jgi:hypothetical protein
MQNRQALLTDLAVMLDYAKRWLHEADKLGRYVNSDVKLVRRCYTNLERFIDAHTPEDSED